MPRYSAPGAIRRCYIYIPPLQFREPVPTYRRRAICCPPSRPGTADRRLARAGRHPEASRRRPPTSPGADRPPTCFMLPPRELASTGIDLDAVPVPRIEEIFGRGTFTRPIPEHAAVPGQRADRSSGPAAATPSGAPHPPGHMPPPAFIRWHIPAQITQICPLRASHADRQGPAPYRRFYALAVTMDRPRSVATSWPSPGLFGRIVSIPGRAHAGSGEYAPGQEAPSGLS
jgi:hypothetical protein